MPRSSFTSLSAVSEVEAMRPKRMTLSETGFAQHHKVTRREQFLAEMNTVVPWARLVALIERYYPTAEGPGREPAPDETTVCKFRHLLEAHGLGGAILRTVNGHLARQGFKVSTGTIADVAAGSGVVVPVQRKMFAVLHLSGRSNPPSGVAHNLDSRSRVMSGLKSDLP